MEILYNIERVDLTELDPSTGKPATGETAIKTTIKTAKEAKLAAVISEGAEEILRNATSILAVVREDDLLYGYDFTFTDNTFDIKAAQLVAGYVKATGTGARENDLQTPMMNQGNQGKPFMAEIYVANYEGDSIKNYCKITLNKCLGKFPDMTVGSEFYAPEFSIKARENTKAKLPIKSIAWVDSLPAEPATQNAVIKEDTKPTV